MGPRLQHSSVSHFGSGKHRLIGAPDSSPLRKAGLLAALLASALLSSCDQHESAHAAEAAHGAKEEHAAKPGHDEHAAKEEHSGKEAHTAKAEHGAKEEHATAAHEAHGGAAEHGEAHGEKHAEEEEVESQLILTRPLIRDTLITRDFVCQIKACRHIEVCALERGYLQAISVKEGQLVKEGEVMFQILPIVYQAHLRKEEAEAQVAQVEYSNTKRLLEMNVVSDKELAMSKARLDMTLAQVNMAKTHLGFTTIKAAFTGLMDRLRLRNGSLVEEGDLLTTLSDTSEMWVYFNVPEETYLNYMMESQTEEAKQVTLIMANGKPFSEKGRIEVIEGEFDNTTGTILFRADFPNPKGLLRHGETGSIRMSKTLKNALLVPQKSTFEIGEDRYIYVVDKNHIAHPHKLEIIEELEDLYVIGSGLTDKDDIIFEGQRQAHEGYKVEDFVVEEPAEAYKNLKLKAE